MPMEIVRGALLPRSCFVHGGVMTEKPSTAHDALLEIGREGATRRDVFKAIGATALAAALFASAGFDPAIAQELKPPASR